MPWNEACNLINEIQIGVDLAPNAEFQLVEAKNHPCHTYNYNGECGFLIRIGKNNTIEIPFSMLQTVYEASVESGGIYNRAIMKELYPAQVNTHGCHVHVVGRLFSCAGVMNSVSSRNYQILM